MITKQRYITNHIETDIEKIRNYLILEYSGLFTPEGLENILKINSPLVLSTFYRIVKGEYGRSMRHRIYRKAWEDFKGEYNMTELMQVFNEITL